MASLASRFQRRAPDERVGEILSDSNSEIASIDGGDDDSRREKGGGAVASDDEEDRNDTREEERDSVNQSEKPTAARVHQRPTPLQAMKRKNSKWYDSEDDDDWDHVASDGERVAPRATATAPPAPTSTASEEAQSKSTVITSPENNQAKPKVFSPEASGSGGATKAQAEQGGRRSSFQRIVGKTFSLSPFGSKRKGLDAASPASSGPDTPRGGADLKSGTNPKPSTNPVSRMRSPLSDASSVGDGTERALSNASERRLTMAPMGRKRSQENNGGASDHQTATDVASPQSYRNSPAATDSAAASRRRSNIVQSPSAGDDAGPTATVARRGSELPPSTVGDALSPGQRRVPGASPGRPDSGVVLEGWLRQKQRRGVKGMKKWNWRYFVLYAKTLEVRYYADVVQSAWGPIPLGEIGSISLRLIQRIGKPSNLKYKGCRLDITCRNTWGTHYADDYVSSEEENTSNNNYADGDANARARNSTPRSSRVYSLMADSPQTAGVWFTTLDSLLIRSANSPRVDVAPSSASNRQVRRNNSMAAAAAGAATGGGAGRMTARPRASTLDTETLVLCGPNDHVPKPVLTAINFIFDSTPGIETERFYEVEPDAAKLKGALRLLNQYATEASRRPSKEELEQVLDPYTAGAVVKLWLSQLEQPLVPFEMYEDFRALAADAKDSPFELSRNLKALVRALPRRNYSMLACLLFHLNDVDGYAKHNAMDAAALAAIFSEFIVRPRASNQDNPAAAEVERQSLRMVVSEMIAHADAIVDENNETEILERA